MLNDKGFSNDAKGEKPRLRLTCLARGEPLTYECSQCGQPFLLSENRSPKEGVSELWAAFKEHAQGKHPEDADSTKGKLRSIRAGM